MGKLYGALFLLSLIWGTSFLFMKLLVVHLHPAAVVFGRSLFGTVILFIILLFSKEKINFKQLPWAILFFVALTNNALPWLLICTSETKITSSLASIFNATTPVWTLLIGFFFFSALLRKTQWLGIGIGFAGIFILSEIKLGDFFTANTFGMLLMSGAAICYGIGAQLSKKYLSHLSVLQISFFTLTLSTLISFIFMLFLSPHSIETVYNVSFILPFIGLGSLGSGVAYLLYYFLVQKGSAEFASLVTYIVPVSAIAWGAILLKEPVHFSMLLGLLIILAGVYITSMKSKASNANEKAA